MRRVRRGCAVAVGVLLLAGVAGCGASSERDASQQPQGATVRVRIGTQAFPEAQVIGELWRTALAVNGYTVDLRTGVGPAEDLDQALQDGEIDGYVAYTGTVLSVVAGEDVSGLDPEETYDRTAEFYASQDMFLSAMTPFENKDALAVTRERAQRDDLTTIADLAGAAGTTGPGGSSDLTLGARPEFEDLYLGLDGLREVYGLDELTFLPLELGTQYEALDDGRAAVVDAFTTDPQLESGAYTLLEDPELLFGSQNVAMAVGQDKLDSIDSEAFLTVVDTVNASLSEEAIISMNAEVTDGRDPADVATSYLREQDLMTPLDLD